LIKLDLVLYPNSSPTHFPHPHQSPWLEAIAGIRQRLCPRLGSKPVPALCRYYAGSPDHEVGKLGRGRTYAPKFPGATRRDFTRNRGNGPTFSGAGPYKTSKKARHFPALRAGKPTTRFPRTWRIYFRRKVGGEVQLRGGAVAWGAHARAKCLKVRGRYRGMMQTNGARAHLRSRSLPTCGSRVRWRRAS
jgi:hypothetical protein